MSRRDIPSLFHLGEDFALIEYLTYSGSQGWVTALLSGRNSSTNTWNTSRGGSTTTCHHDFKSPEWHPPLQWLVRDTALLREELGLKKQDPGEALIIIAIIWQVVIVKCLFCARPYPKHFPYIISFNLWNNSLLSHLIIPMLFLMRKANYIIRVRSFSNFIGGDYFVLLSFWKPLMKWP